MDNKQPKIYENAYYEERRMMSSNEVKKMEEYLAIGYVRLSKDDHGEKKDSLENQKDIISRYASEHGIRIIRFIEDDDTSGYLFDGRDGLTELRREIVLGNCDMVLAKDLSRLGRDNAHILLLIDFFEESNVRYILPNEGHDSLTGDRSILGIKAWYNDFYGRDISNKMKGTLHEIQKKVGLVTVPPYGYKKCFTEVGEKYIEVDEYAACVVKIIFDLYRQGYGVKNISKTLNEAGYDTPNERRKKNYTKSFVDSEGLWGHTSIARILENEAYVGTLVNRKTEIRKISTSLTKALPESERVRHKGYFQPILDSEEFFFVQKLIKDRATRNIRVKSQKMPHLLTGFIECGDCGHAMIYNASRRTKNKKTGEKAVYASYVCGRYHKFGLNYCKSHSISESAINKIIQEEVMRLAKQAELNYDVIDLEMEKVKKSKLNHHSTINSLKISIANIEQEIQNYILEKNAGRIPEKMANKFIEDAMNKHSIAEEQIKKVEALMDDAQIIMTRAKRSVDVLEDIVSKGDFSRQDVELLINKVKVFDTKEGINVEIEWNTPFSYHEVLYES